ncbi:hypothetical protein F5H01DRAFT_83226 [Linnemannia elongata]|nr:hypothetical protein F5H01DRAFT_83226 [Linnemannia elongata]
MEWVTLPCYLLVSLSLSLMTLVLTTRIHNSLQKRPLFTLQGLFHQRHISCCNGCSHLSLLVPPSAKSLFLFENLVIHYTSRANIMHMHA